MANTNYVLSVLPKSLIRLGDIFGGTDTRYANYANRKSMAIKTLLDRQTAKVNEIFSDNRCIGIDVTFLKDCTALASHTCETVKTTDGCGIAPPPETMQSQKVTVNPTCAFTESFSLNDDLCSNEFKAQEIVEQKLAHAIDNLDIRINRNVIAQISAKATPNSYPATIGTPNGNVTDIPAAQWDAEALISLEQVIDYHGFGNFTILDAYNLKFQRERAQYLSLNVDGKDGKAIFMDYPQLVFDNTRDIDATLGRRSTLAWDNDMVAFVNRSFFPSMTPELVDSATNSYQFHAVSPRTGLKYDIEYQKTCQDTRDANGNRVYVHTFLVKFLGGIVFAPVQCDNSNGVLEFVYV